MEPFDGLAEALASLIGATPEGAGWILGLATVGLLAFAVMVVLDKNEMQVGFIFAGIATAFVVGVEWWPIWAAVMIILFVALAIINPFESLAGG